MPQSGIPRHSRSPPSLSAASSPANASKLDLKMLCEGDRGDVDGLDVRKLVDDEGKLHDVLGEAVSKVSLQTEGGEKVAELFRVLHV